MFQQFEWNFAAVQYFAHRERPALVYSEDDSGIAIIPSAIADDGSVVLLGETLFDYRNVLWIGDHSIVERAWQELAALGPRLQLTALREDQAAVWDRWETLPFCCAPCLRAEGRTKDEFVAEHSRMAHRARRIRRRGIELKRYTGQNESLLRVIYRRKGEQGDPSHNLFSDSVRRDFMVDIAVRCGSRCEIFTYETAGELVAAIVTFRDRNVRRCYTIYFDSRWAELSPGQVLLYEVTADAIESGLDVDYMTGEYPYKMRLANEVVPLYRIDAPTAVLAGEERDRVRLAA